MIEILTKKRKLNNTIAIFCFFLYGILGVFINSYIVSSDVARLVINILRIGTIAYLFFDALVKSLYTKIKINIIFYVICFLSLLVFIFSKNYQLLFLCVFLFFLMFYNFKEILKVFISSKIIGIIIVISLAFLGVIENVEFTRYMGTKIRYSLGFIAPAIASGYLLHVLFADLILHKFKLSYPKIFSYLLANFALFYLTDTRFETIIILGLLIFSAFFKRKAYYNFMVYVKRDKIVKALLIILPILLFLANAVLLIGYQNGIQLFISLADRMSSRVQYTIKAIDITGISLFGKKVDYESFGVVLDSSYFKALLEYGLFGLFILLTIYCYIMYYSIKTKKYALFFVTLIILIENIFSPFALDYNYNIVVLLFAKTIISRRKTYVTKKYSYNCSCNIQ